MLCHCAEVNMLATMMWYVRWQLSKSVSRVNVMITRCGNQHSHSSAVSVKLQARMPLSLMAVVSEIAACA